MSGDWRVELAAARRPATAAQAAWDAPWEVWRRRALSRGRTQAEAVEYADREMTERHGPRPREVR